MYSWGLHELDDSEQDAMLSVFGYPASNAVLDYDPALYPR